MTRTMKFMTTAALAMMIGAVPAAAMPGVATPPRAEMPEPKDAAALREAAEALFAQPKQWKKAGRLLEESARLRAADDPEAYECLMVAARIRSALGDYSGARQNLEKAAEHALARGAVLEAAHAFVDAAHVAVSGKQPESARKFLTRAGLLVKSPLLTEEQRAAVLTRIG